MKKVVLSQYVKNNLNSGPKAKVDIENILKQSFQFQVHTFYLKNDSERSKLWKFQAILRKRDLINNSCKDADVTVIQAPFTNFPFLTRRISKKILWIHDIEGLRTNQASHLNKELRFFQTCDILVVHNDKMKQFLVSHGICEEKIRVLELFDYLVDGDVPWKSHFKANDIKVIYTGNLDKAPFLKQLESSKMNFDLFVYGVGNTQFDNSHFTYQGKYLPDELPLKIVGDLGLVWDGNWDESDENIGFKNYTKYNNPHKLSCYLAANKPVIVWEKSAVADFVKRNNIGYTIQNLYDINQLDFSDYEEKMQNACKIGKMVREGYFTKRVMKDILKDLS